MASPQLATRVPQDIFDIVDNMSVSRSVNRAEIVKELIMLGINSKGVKIDTGDSVYKSAKKLTKQLTRSQDEINRLQIENSKMRELLEKGNTGNVKPLPSHHLIDELNTDGIKVTINKSEVVLRSLTELLDFISNQKMNADEQL